MHLKLTESLKSLLLLVRVCLLISSLVLLSQCLRFNSAPIDNNSDNDGDMDMDIDGIINANDNCPNDSNPDQKNSDGADDGGDACDLDDDNDSIDDLTDIDDDGDGLIELDNDDTTANPGSIKNMYRKNDGSHYNDGSGGITTGCGDGTIITACNGYELVEDVTIDSNWKDTIPGPSHTPDSSYHFSAIFDGNGHSIIMTDNITLNTFYVGLFGYVTGVLRNFTLRSAMSAIGTEYNFIKDGTSGNRRMGTVAGALKGKSNTEYAVVDRVYVVNVNLLDGETNSTSPIRVGGLVGYLEESVTVTNSYTNANIMLSVSLPVTLPIKPPNLLSLPVNITVLATSILPVA